MTQTRQPKPTSCLHHCTFVSLETNTKLYFFWFYFILFYFLSSKSALITHRLILLMPNATSEWLIKSTLPPLSIFPSKNFPGKSNSRKTILKLRTFYGSSRRYYEEQQKFKVFCSVREEDNNKRNGKFGFWYSCRSFELYWFFVFLYIKKIVTFC